MKYFKYFPKIYYPTKIGSNGVYDDFHRAPNILLGVRFREVLRKNTVFFYPYTVTDEDRPDIISSKYYGSPDYTWVLLLTNDIFDLVYDWPLTYYQFISYLKRKYESIEYTQSTVKQYLTIDGFEVDYDTWLTIPVVERTSKTIYEWENELNEAKRSIKILEDSYLSQVVLEFKEIMKKAA